MSNRTTAQKLARALQRLAEDELGKRPKLTTCHNIVRDTKNMPPGSREEKAAALFFLHRDTLLESAKIRELQAESRS